MRYGVWRVNGLDQRTDDPLYGPLQFKGIELLFHETDTRGKKKEKASTIGIESICTFDELLKCDIIDVGGEDAQNIIGMIPKTTKIVSRVLATDTLINYNERTRNRVDAFMLNWKMPIPKDFPKEKCHYIAGPIDTNMFRPVHGFTRSPRPEGMFCVLYVGSMLFLTKGVGDLVNSTLSAAMKNNKIRLAIFGEDGSETAKFYNMATNGIVTYGGFIPSRAAMVHAYLDSDVFCQPTIIGQGSTSMLEAMSCGLPLLARDCGENGYEKELIEDKYNGYICGGGSDLSEKIVYLSNNPSIVKEMGEHSRAKVLKEFSQKTSTAKLLQLIEKLGFQPWKKKK